MKCPKCNGEAGVVDSSFNPEDNEYYRRRKCKSCGHSYYTIEFEVSFDESFKETYTKHHRMYAYRNKKN